MSDMNKEVKVMMYFEGVLPTFKTDDKIVEFERMLKGEAKIPEYKPVQSEENNETSCEVTMKFRNDISEDRIKECIAEITLHQCSFNIM